MMNRSSALDQNLAERYRRIRCLTETLCQPLAADDYNLQGMESTSPPKWHLAHTSWFFETFVLRSCALHYQPFHPDFDALFNSYYYQVGTPYPRHQRGLLSRPTTATVYRYRSAVDEAILTLLDQPLPDPIRERAHNRVELGLQHEQQHQELLLMDLKYSLSLNPLRPAYQSPPSSTPIDIRCDTDTAWLPLPTGPVTIGASSDRSEFCFDNESPPHTVWLTPAAIASRPVTNADFMAFIEDGGYQRPELWLADGWATVLQQGWQAPLYWQRHPEAEEQSSPDHVYTLYGLVPIDPDAPVCHVSHYEADAYARWARSRLPTEAEWEVLAMQEKDTAPGQFLDHALLQPRVTRGTGLFGGVWEWTASAYAPYPGYRPATGALGEYNGKFMSNQYVLRGGSCITPYDHIRATYRNFFYPDDRWAFSGIRLARDRDAASAHAG